MKKIVYIEDFVEACKNNLQGFILSSERKERAEKLFSNQEKERFTAAELITQKLIEQYFGIADAQICGAVSQKPYILNHPDISFSRSYCGDGLVVALEDAEKIGVDSEIIKAADETVMKYFFTENEKAFVQNALDPDFAFTLIWTRKECYIKCIGEGLQYQWNLLDVTPRQVDLSHSPLSQTSDPVGDFYINSYLIGKTVLSICSQNNGHFPSIIQEWRSDEKDNR